MAHFVTLERPVTSDVADDFLAKLQYISESLQRASFVDDKLDRVQFELRPGGIADDVAGRIKTVAAKMASQRRPAESRVLVDRLDRAPAYGKDPHEELLATGELVRFGPGRYGFGPKVTHLVRAFEALVHRHAREFAPTQARFPTLIGGDVLDRCAYLRSFPHSLSLVSHLREDLPAIQEFAKRTHWESDRLDYPRESLATASCLMSPSVCFHWYASRAGQRLPAGLACEATGKCFRWESGSMEGLERLYDFTMQEVIFLGSAEEVLARRTRSIAIFTAVFEELGIAFEIRSANDPFFIDLYAPQVAFQTAFELKFELRALLPYKKKTFAVGSFNVHQDVFGRAFDIRDVGEKPLHSGCTAFGLERCALMILAQFGLDPKAWPRELSEGLDS